MIRLYISDELRIFWNCYCEIYLHDITYALLTTNNVTIEKCCMWPRKAGQREINECMEDGLWEYCGCWRSSCSTIRESCWCACVCAHVCNTGWGGGFLLLCKSDEMMSLYNAAVAAVDMQLCLSSWYSISILSVCFLYSDTSIHSICTGSTITDW